MRKYIILKPILFVMFGNLKLKKRIYTSSYTICMSASLILFTYISHLFCLLNIRTSIVVLISIENWFILFCVLFPVVNRTVISMVLQWNILCLN